MTVTSVMSIDDGLCTAVDAFLPVHVLVGGIWLGGRAQRVHEGQLVLSVHGQETLVVRCDQITAIRLDPETATRAPVVLDSAPEPDVDTPPVLADDPAHPARQGPPWGPQTEPVHPGGYGFDLGESSLASGASDPSARPARVLTFDASARLTAADEAALGVMSDDDAGPRRSATDVGRDIAAFFDPEALSRVEGPVAPQQRGRRRR